MNREGDGSTTFNLPNFIEKTFWGGSSSGAYLEETLPNISGYVGLGSGTTNLNPSGCLQALNVRRSTTTGNSGNVQNYQVFFNASLGSSVYQDGASVRPNSLQTIICIKY